jgi:hypothetical protein
MAKTRLAQIFSLKSPLKKAPFTALVVPVRFGFATFTQISMEPAHGPV